MKQDTLFGAFPFGEKKDFILNEISEFEFQYSAMSAADFEIKVWDIKPFY